MRSFFVSICLVVPAASLVVSACVGNDPSNVEGAPTEDGSTTDATSNGDTAAPADGSIATDSGVDAGPPCTGTWCTCGTAKNAAFCDDFDKAGEKLAQSWSYDASFASTDGGSVSLVTTNFESKPRSMNATVVGDDLHRITAALTEDLTVKPTTIAFDLMLDTTAGNCAGQTIDFAQIGFDLTVDKSPTTAIRFSATNGVPELGLYTAGQTRLDGDASLPSTWVRVRMTARLAELDGGANGMFAAVYVTPAGSDDDADASVLLSGSAQVTTNTTSSWLSIGVLNAENNNACSVYIDNVAIYQ